MSKLTKAQLSAIVVESAAFYGWRTVKKLLRWWNRNHHEIVGHNEAAAKGALTKSIHELDDYKQDRIKRLVRLPKEALLYVCQNMSKASLERRYGSRHFEERDFPATSLKAERELDIDRGELRKWINSCRRKQIHEAVRAKKLPPVPVKEQQPLQPAKPKRKRKMKLSTADYIKNIQRFNASMSSVNNVAGLEG